MIKEPHPSAPVDRWVQPIARFMHIESASGIVLLACTLLALVLTNTAAADWYQAIWHTPIVLQIGSFKLEAHGQPFTLEHLINDGLMTIFFFVVGLEIKRELVMGELRDPKRAALPALAALGGMMAPASIYLALQFGRPGEPGWGIPMATDIAFVVGFLALLGKRVPAGLKIMLLSLAIVDDIGAILVIALFYSKGLSFVMLGLAAAGFALIWFFNRIGVRRVPIYVFMGVLIWLAVFESGIHPTVAGVLLGLLTPASAWFGDKALSEVVGDIFEKLQTDVLQGDERHEAIDRLSQTSSEDLSPLQRLEAGLHPWVAFGIMPLFALANAGVPIDPTAIADPIAAAVIAGLVLGKPIGIVLFSWLGVRLGLARLPTGVDWKVLFGGGCLAGIGFTMSLFIASLAFADARLAAAKIGVLAGSTLSAVLGSLLLIAFLKGAVNAASEREAASGKT